MTSINRSALVMHSVGEMYSLVNDVSNYPNFMDGCVGVEIYEHSDSMMLARLDLKKAGVSMSFITRNYLDAPNTIRMTLEEGPFKTFRGDWMFTPLSAKGCKIELDLQFEFISKTMSFAASELFSRVSSGLVKSLCNRANDIYS